MVELIEIINNTKKNAPEHFATLLGERKSGSKWGRGITEGDILLFAEKAVDVTTGTDSAVREEGCRYFKFDITSLCPKAVENYAPAGELEHCYVMDGAHGPELVSDEVKVRPAKIGHFITGPLREDLSIDIVYTVYPGRLSPQPDPRFFEHRSAGDIVSKDEIIAAGGSEWPVKGMEKITY